MAYHLNSSAAAADLENMTNLTSALGVDNNISVAYVHHTSVYDTYEYIIYSYVTTTICVFGVLGNLLNILLLRATSSSSSSSCAANVSRMERSVHFGLIALSVSDLMVCVATLPSGFLWKATSSDSPMDLRLFYWAYSDAIINTFIQSSTWLTVMMAVSRYLAICHPFKARRLIGMTFTRVCTCCIILACVALNIPRYFFWTIESTIYDGTRTWFLMMGPMKADRAELIYQWLYFITGILLPLVVLTFSNLKLLQTLRFASERRHGNTTIRKHQSGAHTTQSSSQRITLTLVIIVIVYTLCLVPAEVANFIKYLNIVNHNLDLFNFVLSILNTFQAVNFAFNFILYCSVNREFRRKLLGLLTACCPGNAAGLTRQHGSVTSNGKDTTGITDVELQPLDSITEAASYGNRTAAGVTK